MNSITARLENIKANKHWPELLALPRGAHSTKVALLCYGPSLRDTWDHIDPDAIRVTVSGAHDFMLARGIAPEAHVEFDPRPHKAKHVAKPSMDTIYYLASCVHPDVFEELKDRTIFMWHAKQGDASKEEDKLLRGKYLIPGGSSAGLRAIELLYALGYREFDIHGMDSSFRDEQWAGPHYGESKNVRDVLDAVCCGRAFKTSVAFRQYAVEFLHCRKLLRDARFNLMGDGLLQWAAHNEKKESAA